MITRSRGLISLFSLNTLRLNNLSSRTSTQILGKHFSSNVDPSTDTNAAKYCLNLVQQYDFENFLCTLLLKEDKRRYAFAIRAFNVEVARVGSSVSEEIIGKMKLKFWHDSIDKCFDQKNSYVLDNPVLKEIKYAVDNNKLTKTYLKRLVTARDRPSNQGFLTTKEMEDYAEKSVSSLYYMLIELYGIKDLNVDHAISHLGKAQGITNLLRAIPYKKRSEAVSIPQEVLMKHGVSQERIMRDKTDDKGVEECIFEVATVAHQHLEKSRQLSKNVPKSVRPLLLPAVAVQRYLDRLRKSNFRLTEQKMLQRDQMLPVAFYWHKLRSQY